MSFNFTEIIISVLSCTSLIASLFFSLDLQLLEDICIIILCLKQPYKGTQGNLILSWPLKTRHPLSLPKKFLQYLPQHFTSLMCIDSSIICYCTFVYLYSTETALSHIVNTYSSDSIDLVLKVLYLSTGTSLTTTASRSLFWFQLI